MMCLQRIEGVMKLDRIRHEDIQKSLGQVTVVDMIEERQNI